MKISFLPKTKLGISSAILTLAFFLLLGFSIFISGFRWAAAEKQLFDNPVLCIPLLTAVACSVTAAVTGVLSAFKKERSVLVLLCVIIDIFFSYLSTGELFFTH